VFGETAAFNLAEAFFQQGDAFFVGADLDIGRAGLIVEGAEDFGLHVAHGINDLVEAHIDVGAQICEVLA
jgi:hypothetical protein